MDTLQRDTKSTQVRNANIEHLENLSSLDVFALWITKNVGSMGFFLIVLLWTLVWIGWNVFLPESYHFDPFPAFVLWLFISNMLQIFLMPLIMIGQNLQGRHAETRAEADYDVNLKAEKDIQQILEHLEKQNELLKKIIEK